LILIGWHFLLVGWLALQNCRCCHVDLKNVPSKWREMIWTYCCEEKQQVNHIYWTASGQQNTASHHIQTFCKNVTDCNEWDCQNSSRLNVERKISWQPEFFVCL
jgi:hypothetical protein